MIPSTQQFILSGKTITSDNNNGLIINGINLTGTLVNNNQTGSFVTSGQTGIFITTGQSGLFYAASNPSSYVTSIQTGNLTGNFINRIGDTTTGNFISSGLEFYITTGIGTGYNTQTGGSIFDMIYLGNSTTGLSGSTTQYSPAINFSGNMYRTGIGFTGNNSMNWRIYQAITTGLIVPSSSLNFDSATGGNYTNKFSINSNGGISVNIPNLNSGLAFSGISSSGVGLTLGNPTTGSTTFGVQCSPSLNFSGNYYATGAGNTGVSLPMVWRIYATGSSGIAGNTNQQLNFDFCSGTGSFLGGVNGIFFNYNGGGNNGKITAFDLIATSTVTTLTLGANNLQANTLNNISIFINPVSIVQQGNIFTPVSCNLPTGSTGNNNLNLFTGNYISASGGVNYTNVLVAPNYNFTGLQTGTIYDLRVNSSTNQISGATHYLLDCSNSGNSHFCIKVTGGNIGLTGITTGYVGINNINPKYQLDCSGSGNFSNGVFITGVPVITIPQYRAGTVAVGSSVTTQAVTFSSNFTGTNYSVGLTPDSTMATANTMSATSKTVSGFTIGLTAGVVGGFNCDYTAWLYN